VPPEQEEDTPQSYRAAPNVVYVGGTPSDISFVQTDGGLRLAALVPSRSVMTLVDPGTGLTSEIELGAPFTDLSLITSIVGETDYGSDVALLWSSASSNIAFVALGSTVGQPYRSVDVLELEHAVTTVHEIPAPHSHLKILGSPNSADLTVLDLLARTASPISSSSIDTVVSVSPDGERAWISAGGTSLAQLDLDSLHPRNFILSSRIQDTFDIGRLDGGRALVAVHPQGAIGITVLDAHNPALTHAREYVGVLMGGL